MPAKDALNSIIYNMTAVVRERVFLKMLDTPADYDPLDLERVQKNEWFIKKFVIDKIEEVANVPTHTSVSINFLLDHTEEMVAAAVKMCTSSLKWRKLNEVNDTSGSWIPIELFTKQLILIDEQEKTMTIRLQVYRTVSEWVDVYERSARYMMEHFEQTVKQGSLIIDLRNVTYKNIDQHIIFYLINVYLNHYPQMFTHFVLYEIPWLIKPIAKVITMCLPERYRQRVLYCSQGTLLQLLDKNNPNDLSEFFGGKRVLPVIIPSDSPSVFALGSKLKKSKTSTEALAKILK